MKTNLLFCLLLMAACTPKRQNTTTAVNVYGELRQVMHQGDLKPRVALDSLKKKGLYAVGALDSLKGEILIENGHTLISTVDNGAVSVRNVNDEFATLLVASKVTSWDTLQIIGDQLETVIGEKAEKLGLGNPFPLIIRGSFPVLQYHVINFDPATGDLSRHKEGAYHGDLSNQMVTIIGFYSDHHQGIFTHHDSNVHLHVRNEELSQMGHVDRIEPGSESFTLLLPKP